MRELGIYTRVFAGDFVEILNRIKGLGLTHFHLSPVSAGFAALPVEIDENKLNQIKSEIGKSDLKMCGISATFNMIHPDKRIVEEGIEAFRVLAYISAPLGNPMLSLCTGSRDPENKWRYHPENDSPKSWMEMCRILEQLLLIAEECNVWLGIEPERGNVVSDARKARLLLEDMQSSRLGIIFDPANIIESKLDEDIDLLLTQSMELLADTVKVLHVKDRNRGGKVCAAGKGVINFGALWQTCLNFHIAPTLVIHDHAEDELEGSLEYLRLNLNWNNED